MRDVATHLFFRTLLLAGLCAATPACEGAPEAPPGAGDSASFEEAVPTASAEAAFTVVNLEREPVSGEVAHYTVVVRLGDTPSAEIAIHSVVRERSPWIPRPSARAVVLLHGDFATFRSNFLPPAAEPVGAASHGLAGYLAEQGIDVWGVDRRWTRTPAGTTDFSDYATMGLAQDLDDTARALAFARAVRALTGSGGGPLFLGGFSHGAQLAYEYAGAESQKPPAQRHIKALIPIDIYDRIAPEDETLREAACASRDAGRSLLQDSDFVPDNSFVAMMGDLAEKQPNDPSPLFDGHTNREAVLLFMGKTWTLYAPTPTYHLAGGVFSGNAVTAMRYSPEARLTRWLTAAPPYQSILESVDLDAIWCGEAPRPVADHLADIQVPLFYLGAAGGFGARGLHTTAVVGSTDVTTLVLTKLPAAQETEDLGHADLLYSDEATALAWEPLAAWIQGH